MKSNFTVSLFVLVVAAFSAGATETNSLPFAVGEKLQYAIYWGPFPVGRASLEVVGMEKVGEHDCYHLVAEARTSGLAESLYPVRSKTESWWDAEELVSRKYVQNRSEGSHKRQDETLYDYASMTAVTTNLVNGKVGSLKLEQGVQDVLTAIYWMRANPMELDQEQSLVVNASRQNHQVSYKPDSRKDMSVRSLGKVTALRIEPNPTIKVVSSNGGRMWLWVSDDERRLPLEVVATMKIGSARLVLTGVTVANGSGDTRDQGAVDRRAGPTTNFSSASPAAAKQSTVAATNVTTAATSATGESR